MSVRRVLAVAVTAGLTVPLAVAGVQSAAASDSSVLSPPSPARRPVPHDRLVNPPITRGTTFLVNTTPGTAGAAAARTAITALHGQVTTAWPEIGVTVGVVAKDADADRIVVALRKRPGIQSAGVSGLLRPDTPRQPHITAKRPTVKEVPGNIAAGAKGPQANTIATGRGVTIGIADTGVLEETSELAGRVDTKLSGSCVGGGRYRPGGGAWRPSTSDGWQTHGTEVSSAAAAAADGVGMRGIAPQARIVALRVVSEDGNIYPEASICAAMTGAAKHLPIVNHSYGIDSAHPKRHTLWDPAAAEDAAVLASVAKAFAYSRKHGVLDVAATGNGGEDLSDKPHIPLPASEERGGPLAARLRAMLAEVPGVLGVGESQADRTVTFESTVGFDVADIAAVGDGMLAERPNTYTIDAGTSFSAPAVAGTAALVKQLRPKATPEEIEKLVLTSAVHRTCANAGPLSSEQPCRIKNGVTNYFGHGILDAYAAVKAARAAG